MNSRSEFLTLFLAHESSLRAFLGSLVRDRNSMEDVFQETALTLWEKFDSYDSSRSFGAWARGIAAKKVLQFKDRQGRAPVPFSPSTIQAIVDAFDRQPAKAGEVDDALDRCLGGLSDKYRVALRGWAEDQPIREIATQMGVNTAAAYKALQRSRVWLLNCIQRRLGVGPKEVPK